MSDSLKDRLASHSGAFEGLLSLIPAKYYYEDDAKTQLKDADAKGSSKPKTANRTKDADPDAEVGLSALDELKRREGTTADGNEPEEDEEVPIFDDFGNQISGPRELTIQEILQAKARGESVPPQDASERTEASQKVVQPKQSTKSTKREPPANKKKKTESTATSETATDEQKSATAPVVADGAKIAEPEGGSAEEDPAETSKNNLAANAGSSEANGKPSVESKKGIAELRAKLAARISEMRNKRKAPGSSAPGAPKNREELLAQRKQRQEQKLKTQSLKRKRNGDDNSDDEDQGDDINDAVNGSGDAKLDQKIMFGQVQFNDGARLGRDLDRIEEQKRVKKRNAADQLRVIESRKAKMEELAEEKKKEVAENAKWSRAILQSEGAKIRDDEKLLRKTLRTKERQKSKSAKAWRDRKETVTTDIAAREAKRTANIKAHREAKQLRLKGKKRKEHMKRAGFEGKRR